MAKKATRKPSDTRTEAQKAQDKKDAFVRVVTPRVNKALHAISNVQSCASAIYTYSDAQKNAIIQALKAAVENCEAAYKGEAKGVSGFQLPE